MVHTIEIIRVKDEFHIMNNGGLAFRFDATIFDQAQIMQFAKKEFEILEKNGDTVNIKYGKGMSYVVCEECGSDDVEIKAFVNQKTNHADYSTYDDESDTWCNVCLGHNGIRFKKVRK